MGYFRDGGVGPVENIWLMTKPLKLLKTRQNMCSLMTGAAKK